MLELEIITEYTEELGMRPEASVADKLTQAWNEVGVSRTEKLIASRWLLWTEK